MRIPLLLAALACGLVAYAENVKTLSAMYTYYPPETMSLEDAKRTAYERAKIQAIADEFGTIVAQTNITNISNDNENSTVNFQSIGASEVKGEWIEDTETPQYAIQYIDGALVINVKIKGKARELKGNKYECSARILRNKDEKNETTKFNAGDHFVLSFQSSVNGFLVVYLLDGDGVASCLLPYAAQSEPNMPIKANVKYILFDTTVNKENYVDEYYLTCSASGSENNQLYVIFSSNKFSKAIDAQRESDDSMLLPRELPAQEFNKWLAKSRRRDSEMQVITKTITISNN